MLVAHGSHQARTRTTFIAIIFVAGRYGGTESAERRPEPGPGGPDPASNASSLAGESKSPLPITEAAIINHTVLRINAVGMGPAPPRATRRR